LRRSPPAGLAERLASTKMHAPHLQDVVVDVVASDEKLSEVKGHRAEVKLFAT